MTDIHAHILPWIDDGAVDLYDTLLMARKAVDSGVTAMVATPHCNIPGLYGNYYGNEYKSVFERACQALKDERIPLTLYPGMEVYATSEVPKLLSQGKLMTLNNSKYLLIEFDFKEEPDFTVHLLRKIRELGIRPVISHVERYAFIQDAPEIVYNWHEEGYLIQVNKSSFFGGFGKEAQQVARQLLRRNLISVVASDAHGPYQRTPWMKTAYDELAKEIPKRYMDALFDDNPRRICGNQPTFRFQSIDRAFLTQLPI